MKFLVNTMIFIGLSPFFTWADEHEVTLLAGLVKPPFILPDDKGMQIEIIQSALAKNNYQVNFLYLPINRHIEVYKKRNIEGLITMSKHENGLGLYLSQPYISYHNVVITIKLLELLKQSKNLKKLVYSASSACYGTPINYPTTETEQIQILSPYALQKYSSEQYCLVMGERFDIPVVALRYFNAYGPRSFNPENKQNAYSSVLGIFNAQKANNTELTITGKGNQKRDFVHTEDIANANYLAAISSQKGKFYNVGFGECYTILEIAKMFDAPHKFIPERKGEALITHANIDKIKAELGWTPKISIKEGILKL